MSSSATISQCLINFFLASTNFYWSDLCSHYSTPLDQLYASYDFIIVGGGTAGSTLAGRLSEIPSFNVLLLESGGVDNQWSDIPYTTPQTKTTKMALNFKTLPQKRVCQSNPNRACDIAVGHILGGCSTLGTIYVRGSPLSYNEWEDKFGAQGWRYKNVLPYFKKLENATNRFSPDYYGKSGPIHVTKNKPSPLIKSLLKAADEMGFRVGDYNGKHSASFDVTHRTLYNGSRWSTQRAYLDPVLGRSNLHIRCFAHVKRITFHGKRATGVEFYDIKKEHGLNRAAHRVIGIKASREVILSAGAIRSPQLLMVSGIGPKEVLDKLNIPIVAGLPGVGENYQNLDQVVLQLLSSTLELHSIRQVSYHDYFKYSTQRKGKLLIAGESGVGYVTSPISNPADPQDTGVEYYVDPVFFQYKLINSVADQNQNGFGVSVIPVPSYSRGYVSISSVDSRDQPIVDSNTLSDPKDQVNLMYGIRVILNMTTTSAWKAIGAQVIVPNVTQCNHFNNTRQVWSNHHLACLFKYITSSSDNYAGTCKMGQSSDRMSVVNSRLEVLGGIERLRIVDASIMPQGPRSRTTAPTIMIAERAGDIIKCKYGAMNKNHCNDLMKLFY